MTHIYTTHIHQIFPIYIFGFNFLNTLELSFKYFGFKN